MVFCRSKKAFSRRKERSKLDLENAKYFDRYLDAVKTVKGYSLGDFKDGEGA